MITEQTPSQFPVLPSGASIPGKKVDPLAQLALQILEHKESAKEIKLNNTFNRFNPAIIGGDILTIATLVLALIEILNPGLANINAVLYTTTACSIAAGVINVSVGCIEGKQATQCFLNSKGKEESSLQGKRYAIDCATMNVLGLVMILTALAPVVSGLSPLNNFFNAHEYILPAAFFIASLPVVFEVGRRVKNIQTKTDFGSQLNLEEIQNAFDDPNEKETPINQLLEKLHLSEDSSPQELRSAIETLQEEMGVEAAIPIFKLLHALLTEDKEAAKEHLALAQREIGSWNKIQQTRFFQQTLYIIAFILSMLVLIPGVGAHDALNMTISDEVMLLLANIIPFAIDLLYPFKRNPHIVVPGISDEELLNEITRSSEDTAAQLQLKPHDSMSEVRLIEADGSEDLSAQIGHHLEESDLQPS